MDGFAGKWTRGKASAQSCVVCGGEGYTWVVKEDRSGRAVEHYDPMCRGCARASGRAGIARPPRRGEGAG